MTDLLNVGLSCDDVFFEILKMKIRSITISYSIKNSKQEKCELQKFQEDIQLLENNFHQNHSEEINKNIRY